jgi:putative addiction module antidote
MVLKLKLRKVGNSVGLVLPKDALALLKSGEGDDVYLTEAAEGAVRITAADPEFERQIVAAQSVIKRYRNTLRRLSK